MPHCTIPATTNLHWVIVFGTDGDVLDERPYVPTDEIGEYVSVVVALYGAAVGKVVVELH